MLLGFTGGGGAIVPGVAGVTAGRAGGTTGGLFVGVNVSGMSAGLCGGAGVAPISPSVAWTAFAAEACKFAA